MATPEKREQLPTRLLLYIDGSDLSCEGIYHVISRLYGWTAICKTSLEEVADLSANNPDCLPDLIMFGDSYLYRGRPITPTDIEMISTLYPNCPIVMTPVLAIEAFQNGINIPLLEKCFGIKELETFINNHALPATTS